MNLLDGLHRLLWLLLQRLGRRRLTIVRQARVRTLMTAILTLPFRGHAAFPTFSSFCQLCFDGVLKECGFGLVGKIEADLSILSLKSVEIRPRRSISGMNWQKIQISPLISRIFLLFNRKFTFLIKRLRDFKTLNLRGRI